MKRLLFHVGILCENTQQLCGVQDFKAEKSYWVTGHLSRDPATTGLKNGTCGSIDMKVSKKWVKFQFWVNFHFNIVFSQVITLLGVILNKINLHFSLTD